MVGILDFRYLEMAKMPEGTKRKQQNRSFFSSSKVAR